MATSSRAYAAPYAAKSPRLVLANLPRAALLTIGLAAVLNVALFFVFSAVGLLTESVLIPGVAGPPLPLMAVSVAGFTVLQLLVGALVLTAIIRFRPSNAERTWRIVAGIVLVLSLATPFSGIPGAPLGYLLALEAMHIVAGALAIWMLPTLARDS